MCCVLLTSNAIMIFFSGRRPQYFIYNTKSQRLLVTRHRLSSEKVNFHNTPVTQAWDARGVSGHFGSKLLFWAQDFCPIFCAWWFKMFILSPRASRRHKYCCFDQVDFQWRRKNADNKQGDSLLRSRYKGRHATLLPTSGAHGLQLKMKNKSKLPARE